MSEEMFGARNRKGIVHYACLKKKLARRIHNCWIPPSGIEMNHIAADNWILQFVQAFSRRARRRFVYIYTHKGGKRRKKNRYLLYYIRSGKNASCFHFKTSAFLFASSVKRICFTFSRIIVCKSRNENIIVYGYRSAQTTRSILFYGVRKDAARNKGEKKIRCGASRGRAKCIHPILSINALHQITGQFRASSRLPSSWYRAELSARVKG